MKTYNFDYVIFGSGAAGSSIAYQLSKEKTVAIIDIASKKTSDKKNRSIPPYVNSYSSIYSPTYSGVFGGNTELWSGKIYLMRKEEIKDWPISYNELLNLSKELAFELNIPHDEVCSSSKIDTKAFYHKSQRDVLGNLFEYYNLDFNNNISCFENYNLVDFTFKKKKKKVNKIIISSNQENITIGVKNSIILCCGGLGNIPIYLKFISSILDAKSIPSKFNLNDHPHFQIGEIENKNLPRIHKQYLNTSKNNTEDCVIVFGKSHNYAFQIDGVRTNFNFFLKFSRKSNYKLLRNLAIFFHQYVNIFIKVILTILTNGKYLNLRSIEVFFQDSKKTKSYISKSNKLWSDNLNMIDIHYEAPKIDFLELKKDIRNYTNNKLKKFKKKQLNSRKMYSGLHPSCSTPIKKNPRISELDIDLKVKGINNLYILGTNVFPSNGVTNPTWTLMVLAKRLTNHLLNCIV